MFPNRNLGSISKCPSQAILLKKELCQSGSQYHNSLKYKKSEKNLKADSEQFVEENKNAQQNYGLGARTNKRTFTEASSSSAQYSRFKFSKVQKSKQLIERIDQNQVDKNQRFSGFLLKEVKKEKLEIDNENNRETKPDLMDKGVTLKTTEFLAARFQRCRAVKKCVSSIQDSPKTYAVREAVLKKMEILANRKKKHYEERLWQIPPEVIPKIEKLETENMEWVGNQVRRKKNSRNSSMNQEKVKNHRNYQNQQKLKEKMEQMGVVDIEESFQITQIDSDFPVVAQFIAKYSSELNEKTKNRSNNLQEAEEENRRLTKKWSDVITDTAQSKTLTTHDNETRQIEENEKIIVMEESIIMPVDNQLQDRLNMMMQERQKDAVLENEGQFPEGVDQLIERIRNQKLQQILNNLLTKNLRLQYICDKKLQSSIALITMKMLHKIEQTTSQQTQSIQNPYLKLHKQFQPLWNCAAIIYLLLDSQQNVSNPSEIKTMRKIQYDNRSVSLISNKNRQDDVFVSVIRSCKEGMASKYQNGFEAKHFIRDLVQKLLDVRNLIMENKRVGMLVKEMLRHEFLIKQMQIKE